MGAMQTAVVALALGKHSLPTVSEISLRFGARPASNCSPLRSLLFAVRWTLPAPPGCESCSEGRLHDCVWQWQLKRLKIALENICSTSDAAQI